MVNRGFWGRGEIESSDAGRPRRGEVMHGDRREPRTQLENVREHYRVSAEYLAGTSRFLLRALLAKRLLPIPGHDIAERHHLINDFSKAEIAYLLSHRRRVLIG